VLWSQTQKRWYDWPVPILVADGHTVSNAPDLFRPLPKLFIGVGDRPDSPQGAVSFCKCDYGGFAKCWGAKGERESMVRLVPILVADGHTVCGTVASCIPDDQRSPAPPVHTKLLLFAPCTCKAASLLRRNKHVYSLALALWSVVSGSGWAPGRGSFINPFSNTFVFSPTFSIK
jgi:hypothetical protein